jgi:hypothetical protein
MKNNYPIIIRSVDNVQALQQGLCRAIFSDSWHHYHDIAGQETNEIADGVRQLLVDGEIRGLFFDGIYIDQYMVDLGYTPEFFRQSLSGRSLWCYLSGTVELMPPGLEMFKVADQDQDLSEVNGLYRVKLSTEKTVADVLASTYRYAFNEMDNVWEQVSEEQALRNLYKPLIEYNAEKVAGNVAARLADYGRLLVLCLQLLTDKLPAESKEILLPLLERKVAESELTRIISRETKVYDIVDRYKSAQFEGL